MSSKLRVLHILPSVRGYGAERLIVELLKHLSSPAIDASLLTIYSPPPDVGMLPFRISHAGRKHRRDGLFLWRLVREIRRLKPDIVHTHTHVGKYWGRAAALLAGATRIVHTEHNPCDFRRSPFERVADCLLHRATARVVTFFREQGAALREFEHLPATKLVLIPNGLTFPETRGDRNAARRHLGLRAGQFAIIVIGRMEFQKNHILAMRAFAALNAEVRENAVLMFAGSGENEIVLRGLAHALQIEARVRFLGYRTDLHALLPGADLLLMTSWFEGMPLALLEAMIAGVPIVSTPWLGARNMLSDGRYGFLTADFTPAKVATEIQRAMRYPGIRKAIADRAANYVRETYDIDRMVDAHRQMYLQLQGAAS